MSNAVYCDYCGKRVRYCHQLTHPDWPKAILVCSACATKLTGTDCYEHERCVREHNAAEQISDN